MPYPKSSQGYPMEMTNALEEAAANQIVRINCKEKRKAYALRTRFYFYFRALRKDADKPQSWMNEGDFPRIRDLARKSHAVMILIDENTWEVTLKSRDLDEGMAALSQRQVLQPDGEEKNTKIEESINRLKGKIRE